MSEKLPPLTKEPILHVDMTPDEGLVLRILRAYRENCDCRWVSDPPSILLDMMNEHCEKRAKLLDAAITSLSRGSGLSNTERGGTA